LVFPALETDAPMNRRYSIALLCIALLGAECASSERRPVAPADTAPPADALSASLQEASCAHVTLMLDQGWWLHARADGPSTIGYGALPQQLPIEPGVVDAADVCALTADHVRRWQPKGERPPDQHYFDVTFGSDGRVHDIDEAVYPQLFDLFRRAWRHADPDAGPLLGNPDVIIRAWEGAFFLHPSQA
jgi:hypothetical protein